MTVQVYRVSRGEEVTPDSTQDFAGACRGCALWAIYNINNLNYAQALLVFRWIPLILNKITLVPLAILIQNFNFTQMLLIPANLNPHFSFQTVMFFQCTDLTLPSWGKFVLPVFVFLFLKLTQKHTPRSPSCQLFFFFFNLPRTYDTQIYWKNYTINTVTYIRQRGRERERGGEFRGSMIGSWFKTT